MENVRRLLEAAGARMDQVVKCTCYLADIADFQAFDAVYREAFGGLLPARTTVQAGLMGIKIEIDAMAYIGRRVRPRHSASMHMATPMPPPMQSVAIPLWRPTRCSSYSSVMSTRAPDAPIGWPMAMAPPLTLTFAMSHPSS
jgi:hypothetical protein